ncbi:MAG: cardiolipin synthase [Gemmatimonadaceae bacterium]
MNVNLLSTVALASHWLIVVGLSLRVVNRRRPVGVSLAWLAVIFSVPFAGALLYLLLGEQRIGRGRMARTVAHVNDLRRWQATLKAPAEATSPAASLLYGPLGEQAERVLGYPAIPGNAITVLGDANSVFDEMVRDINGAKSTCNVCFYIWHEGGRAAEVVEALVRATRRGVRCRALADAVGSKAFLTGPQASRLRHAGVHLRAALPTSLFRAIFVRADLRNHRKIVVIDGRVAYTGSQNMVDPRFFKQDAGVGEWIDAMARIVGPAAAALDGVFALDWAVEHNQAFEPPPVWRGSPRDQGASVVQVAPSGPDLHPEAIHQLLLTAIYSARHDLTLTTPYFVPDDSILTALLSAALRHVEVTLIVPARSDSLPIRYASTAHFDALMTAGARIYLFHGGLLHTKSMSIDDGVGVVGSVNLDMRSLWLNFEISLFVYDPSFNARLRTLHDGYLAQSERLDLATWRRRPALQQFLEDVFRLLGPLL